MEYYDTYQSEDTVLSFSMTFERNLCVSLYTLIHKNLTEIV